MSDLNDDSKEPVPEADALEQAEPVREESPEDLEMPDSLPDDAPEADALEQATPVPEDDESAPR
jgi:hypothetical protein